MVLLSSRFTLSQRRFRIYMQQLQLMFWQKKTDASLEIAQPTHQQYHIELFLDLLLSVNILFHLSFFLAAAKQLTDFAETESYKFK